MVGQALGARLLGLVAPNFIFFHKCFLFRYCLILSSFFFKYSVHFFKNNYIYIQSFKDIIIIYM
jgi:hypothetical protein